MKRLIIISLFYLLLSQYNYGQSGSVKSISTIALGQGGLSSTIDLKAFGIAVARIGDLDKNGSEDLAVSGLSDNFEPLILILFMNKNGTVKSTVQIAKNKGGFTGDIDATDNFGAGIAALGDLDGDKVPDLAVGSPKGSSEGMIWVLFMQSDGTVKTSAEIKKGSSGFNSSLKNEDYFGTSVASIGDINNDTIPDIAVGSVGDDEGGALWVLLMKKDGTVKSFQKICNSTSTVLNGQVKGGFGSSIALMKDYNKDGKIDIAVGSQGDGSGALFLLSLTSSGTLFSSKKINDSDPLLNGKLGTGDLFGSSIACFGDLDGDGMDDLAVGAPGKKYGTGFYWGKEYLLLLNKDATVKNLLELDNLTSPFMGKISAMDYFGRSSCVIPDMNGDSIPELLIGSDGNDSAGKDKGIVFICYMNGVPQLSAGSVLAYAPIDIFPIPASSELKILLSSNSGIPDEINLINMQGQFLRQFQLENIIQRNTITLDVSEMPAGTYFLELRYQGFSQRKKCLIVPKN